MHHKAHSRIESSLVLALACTLAAFIASATSAAQTETVIGSPGITYAGVIFDTAGNLYGVTENGGNSTNCKQGCGTIYELSPASEGTWTPTTLYDFQGLDDGETPYGGLVFDSAGNLYGTTQVGGTGGGGTVFKFSNANGSWTLTTLYSFNQPNDALYPNSSLIFDAEGNLYGTTAGGGKYAEGAVFKLAPTSNGAWKENVLHSFGAPGDGASPNGPLLMDAQNNLYGTTENGGAEGLGVVFELTHNPGGGWTEHIVYTSTLSNEFGQPLAGVILDSAHNLYGTTFNGGKFGYGSVFRLARIQLDGQLIWKEILLYSFTGGTDGANPAAPLTRDAAGNLYSTTQFGDPTGCNSFYSCGQVFKLSLGNTGHWSVAALYPIPDFLDPNGSLVLDSSGNIYGTAIDNHYFTFGEVYEVSP
ncbi:MAG: choice-of-anchor tandem repeat GloVer-containing protein [Candidatus Sulfotelmatobacter sp.]